MICKIMRRVLLMNVVVFSDLVRSDFLYFVQNGGVQCK